MKRTVIMRVHPQFRRSLGDYKFFLERKFDRDVTITEASRYLGVQLEGMLRKNKRKDGLIDFFEI